MSRIPSTGSTQQQEVINGPRDVRDLDLNEFLQLLITEMQNQDPLNPMDNGQVLEQIGQIRQIGSTEKLEEALTSVQQGQNLATASALIGKEVRALTSDGDDVTGIVDRISVEINDETEERSLLAHIGESSFKISNIREINDQPVVANEDA